MVKKFAIIGCGRIAQKHIQVIQEHPEACLVAVADCEASVLEETKKRLPKVKVYLDYQEMLEKATPDIVNICTPSGLHASMAIAAMNRGIHTIVEKPMAMSLKEAEEMLCAQKRNQVNLCVVHQNRFNKAVQHMREYLENGSFGSLTHGAATIRWNRSDEYYKQTPWRGTWKYDGGCLMNQSIHNIDLLCWMMGEVEAVYAYAGTMLRNIEAEDTAVAVLKFKNGAMATLEATTTIYPCNLEETLSIFGSHGMAVLGGLAVNEVKAWRFANESMEIGAHGQEVDDVYGFGHYMIVDDMIRAIDENRSPLVDGEEGRKALEVVLGIYHSVRFRREVTFPLQEKFRIGIGQNDE